MLTHNAYELANMADVSCPDSPESPGAKFLLGVQDDVNDSADSLDSDVSDTAHMIADAAVPIYTYEKWQTFVDLAAWQEDMDEFGQPEDMDQASNWALYAIANRLAYALLEELQEQSSEEDDEGES
jgi:hypothetical protein